MGNRTRGSSLTLTHQDGQTIFFSDRPERIVGAAPTQAILNSLGFTPVDPPNAAIVAGDEVLIVELFNPAFDATTGTLTYDAIPLDPGDAASGVQHLARRQTDQELPQDLGPTSLFIDSAQDDCTQFVMCQFYATGEMSGSDCGEYSGGHLWLCSPGLIPGAPIDSCWDSSTAGCAPCASGVTYDSLAALCNSTFSQCTHDSSTGTCFVADGL